MRSAFRRRWTRLAALGLALAASACAAPRIPYTAADALRADVGIPGARTWADDPATEFERRTNAAIRTATANDRTPVYLALSGGAGDGAYGAGLLNGWSRSGKRPVFTVVSGVSTGALIAPFAFLGPRYDGVLTELYTSGIAETLLDSPDPFSVIFRSSLFTNDRLKQLVARYVSSAMIAEVAREGARGRLLFALTTDIDAQRPVLWNLTAIAAAGTPTADTLFRDVLVASASIPAVFPPVLIDASANGKSFREMHVDGSVSSNVYTLPEEYLRGGPVNRALVRGGKIFILLNTSPLPVFEVTANKTADITGRTVAMNFKEQVTGDLLRTYEAAQRYGFDFNLTFIDPVDVSGGAIGFDTAYMRRLYERGERIGETGTFWQKKPPQPGTLARTVGVKPPSLLPGL